MTHGGVWDEEGGGGGRGVPLAQRPVAVAVTSDA